MREGGRGRVRVREGGGGRNGYIYGGGGGGGRATVCIFHYSPLHQTSRHSMHHLLHATGHTRES